MKATKDLYDRDISGGSSDFTYEPTKVRRSQGSQTQTEIYNLFSADTYTFALIIIYGASDTNYPLVLFKSSAGTVMLVNQMYIPLYLFSIEIQR